MRTTDRAHGSTKNGLRQRPALRCLSNNQPVGGAGTNGRKWPGEWGGAQISTRNIHSIDGHRNAVVRIATPRAMRPHEKNAERKSGAPATGRDPCRALLTAALVALPLLLAVRPVGAELRPGTVLGPDNWEEAKGLLPDEFLEAYRRGDLRHEIRNWDPLRLQEDDPGLAAAPQADEGR